MLDQADEALEIASVNDSPALVPPVRRGSRDQRREATLRAFAAGLEAHCAYCGRQLPPLPPRGGRPTPYCSADSERYGHWGAKVITCAMLDENREIWVQVYGADQPMTQVDVDVLDDRVNALLAALDPVRTEVTALHARVGKETAAALEAKDAADQARQEAEERARVAESERAQAVAEAHQDRLQAGADRAALRAAEELAARAVKDKDKATDQERMAKKAKDKAEADRERALDQLAAAQDRIAEVQTDLAGERASALERLDQLRQEEAQTRQALRMTLTEAHDEELRARVKELTGQLEALRTATDQRVSELISELTDATRTYAASLGPLHERLGRLSSELDDQSTVADELREELDHLRDALRGLLDQSPDEPDALELLRRRVAVIVEAAG